MNRTIAQHALDALKVQDACNLSGVVHSLDTVVTDLWEEANRIGQGTDWVNTHPIVKAYVDKLASLAGVQVAVNHYETVLEAFDECEKLARME